VPLDQLQVFIAVTEREPVTRGADTFWRVSRSVSAAAASLEREFGTKLFHRV
jgi:DNA-binding transcriptional LysR family regulator